MKTAAVTRETLAHRATLARAYRQRVKLDPVRSQALAAWRVQYKKDNIEMIRALGRKHQKIYYRREHGLPPDAILVRGRKV